MKQERKLPRRRDEMVGSYEMVIYNGESLKIHVKEGLAGISKERFIARGLHDYVDSPNDRKTYFLYGSAGTCSGASRI